MNYFTVSSLVVFSWYVIFTSFFRDQFVGLNKDNSKDDFPSLLDRSPSHANGENEEFLSTHALSFDLEEESFSPGKTSDDVADTRKSVSVKGGRKQVNSSTDATNSQRASNFVQYPDTAGGLKRNVHVSEGSSILKAEQIDLIASWLPGRLIIKYILK
jgi:hypothetical protein